MIFVVVFFSIIIKSTVFDYFKINDLVKSNEKLPKNSKRTVLKTLLGHFLNRHRQCCHLWDKLTVVT